MSARRNPVSPKVAASSTLGAITVLVMYLLGQVPFVEHMPPAVQGALLVVVTAAVVFAAGYFRRDVVRGTGLVRPGVHLLGRLVEHDERSMGFPARRDDNLRSVTWKRYGGVFDQGQLGSCTGNAAAGACNTKPLFDPSDGRWPASVLATEADAVAIYSAATKIDGIDGEYPPDDTGSSGLAVAKVLKARGRIAGYSHAFGIDHFLGALMLGPAIVGTSWTQAMFSPDADGRVHPTGPSVGGHEYEAYRYDAKRRRIWFYNSWSSAWGKGGRFYMTVDDFAQLLDDQGDATVLKPAAA